MGWVNAIVQGILTGGLYALFACGLSLMFGVMKVVNLAQGAMVILAAYLSYTLFTSLGVDPFLSVLITTPALFLLGTAAEWLFLRQLRREDMAELSILVTFAIALAIEGVLSVLYSTTYRSINASYANASSAAGTVFTSCACRRGRTSRAKRSIWFMNRSCGRQPRLRASCT